MGTGRPPRGDLE